ncbi:hypothetical protein ACFQ08_03815 [Streptosporangium algeriense]|uniref:Uncharacterized protein n=1 Tax=Streptosporangium algeriense TaxID=1682748 RepID=A0ABW3DLJ8_9ACTN
MNLGAADTLAINNALNEICNGVHLDDWDSRPAWESTGSRPSQYCA